MLRIFLWFIFIFGGAFLGFYLDKSLFPNIYSNLFFHLCTLILGLILLYFVLKISKNTGRTLAKYGRKGNIPRMQTNILVKQGPYKYMRHPMHLGLLFFPLSIALIIGSPSFILFISPSEIIIFLILIKLIEEPEAIKKFGKQYLEYKKQIPWFCLKKQCLKELLKNIEKNNKQ
jgi:protein-S-isoprenylcysteine O-methyltransferase Ste14